MSDYLSFHLKSEFVQQYTNVKPNWGFPVGGGNTLGEITYLTKYSRLKEDGTKERWFETCERVVNGTTSILKDYCLRNKTPWNEAKGQRTAQEMYRRMFEFKWTPPGRGLWAMGTRFVQENGSAALQNCAFLSTEHLSVRSKDEIIRPFMRMMEMSMLGIGVGFDTRGANKLSIHKPLDDKELFVIDDSREGWFESTGALLLSYLFPNQKTIVFDYTLIRDAGQIIKGFGGVAAGPGPLIALHDRLRGLLDNREGQLLSSSDIVDIMTMEAKCVVSGNVRRSALIALGDPDDQEFLNIKNWELHPERMGKDGWGNNSNNSIFATVGMDYKPFLENITMNGEPGFMYLDLARQYGRMADAPDGKDYRVMGVNPCAEQPLEDNELCCLVETFPYFHKSLDDFKQTLKVAYLYAKAVTLLPTHWPESNVVMQRNRRIGCSVSGLFQFTEARGHAVLREWLDEGYKTICIRDTVFSEWLGVRESIRKGSVKPSGTVSLLNGSTPGGHCPTAEGDYLRRMRLSKNDPLIPVLEEAGYLVEPSVMDPDTDVVVTFPVQGPRIRSEKQVTIWEKISLAVLAQRYWADNQVSFTLTFQEHEKDQVEAVLRTFEGQLKAISFLPMRDGGAYAQMPYEATGAEHFSKLFDNAQPMDWDNLYNGNVIDAEGEIGCSNDSCELKY